MYNDHEKLTLIAEEYTWLFWKINSLISLILFI